MGLVFSIERGATHDGPGLRTTVFFKGCPLRCVWCHNPESLSFSPEEYHLDDGVEIKGTEKTVEEIMRIVRKDKIFFQKSGGGLTLSGGEPLAQIDFARSLLQAVKSEGIHTCVETSGYVQTDALLSVAPYVDLFLYDYKESDDQRHKKYTGVSQKLILDNLSVLNDAGAKIILRCPVIPGYNDSPAHFSAISQTANTYRQIICVHIMPYNPMGASKAKRLGREYKIPDIGFPSDEQVQGWIQTISAKTKTPVVRG
jgi:pyruvate formate lyase activating enzyme